ncbi:hypothetical protein OH76DRAFT_31352 [Lentinus brumalis]|uniref:MYND-type domain-containing protein n=1 Tax=Lentinus brumalis TaxID=2498619 RepID=A0A371DXQ3_9APHY|nr:hypothetical protein OH76DRAFT_31352 [Polyporus brumalis]
MEYFPFVTTAGRMSKFKKAMRIIDANEVRYEHVTQRRCSFCAATSEDPLRQCSVCKSVRYCDEKCQLEDYGVRHKRECGRFVTPPLTRAFLTQSTGNDTIYPKHPVFAKGYHDGVGCWVSHEGRPDFGLQAFATNTWATPETWRKTYSSRVTSYTPLAEKYNALRPNLLTLAVVVQNRRKDKKPIVVFAGRTRVVTKPGADHAVTQAKSDLEDITSYEEEGGSVAALRVAEDPLYRCPRLAIKNVAGVEFQADHPPLSVVNEPHGIVFLAPGEYVVYNVQFRVGDGNKCSTDVDALIHLRALSFVWQLAEDYVPWVQERAEHIRLNPRECPAPKDVGPPPPETLIPFDLPIVFAYYLDAIKEGEPSTWRATTARNTPRPL